MRKADNTPIDGAPALLGDGRNGSGQFAKGWKGGPGRQAGYRSKLAKVFDSIAPKDVKAIREKVIEAARNGDMQAMKLVIDRFWPVPKGRVVRFHLPEIVSAGDIPKALAAVLSAVARGEISPEEGAAVSTVVEQHRKGLELAEIESRLARLERTKGMNGNAQA